MAIQPSILLSGNRVFSTLIIGGKQIPGGTGLQGKSAYQIARDNGFTGTQAEWLASLKGEPSTSSIEYQSKYDEVSDSIIFLGWSLPGTADNAASWKIQKLTILPDGDNVITEWANGTDSFVHLWSSRATYTYTNT